jgi:hypothetical protein
VNNPDPDLIRFLLQVGQGLAELRIDTQAPMEFFHGQKINLNVAWLACNIH